MGRKLRDTERADGAPRHWTAEGLATVLAQFRAGARKADIARQLGLSGERVRAIIAQAERIERLGPDLSARTRKILRWFNLFTIEQIRAAMDAGQLDSNPYFEREGINELRLWLSKRESRMLPRE